MQRKLPPTSELIAMHRSGLSHSQIADTLSERLGTHISRIAVTQALGRTGYRGEGPGRRPTRYTAELPWRIAAPHRMELAATRLRLLGRRNAGLRLSEEDAGLLDKWLAWLDENDAVVAYCPERSPGFYYVVGDEPDDRPDGIPIRPRLLSASEFA